MDPIKTLAEEYLTRTTEKPIVKYIIEQQMSGYRCIVHKLNNVVKLYSDITDDITDKFPTLVSDLEKCSNQDFILDSTIVINNMNDIKLYIFDIMNYNKDISMLSWGERHKYLNKLRYNDTLKLIPSHLVRNQEELTKYVTFVSNLEGSIGANIKALNSTYVLDTATHSYTLLK